MLQLSAAVAYLYVSIGLNLLLYMIMAIFILRRVKVVHLDSMKYLAFMLLGVSICFILYVAFGRATLVYHLIRTLAIFYGIPFVKHLFFEGQRSIYKPMMIWGLSAVAINAIAYLVYTSAHIVTIKPIPDVIFGLLMTSIGMWQYNASKDAYNNLKNVEIEPYIRKRYELFKIASIFFSISGIFCGLIGFTNQDVWTLTFFIAMSTTNIVYFVFIYIVWFTPQKLRIKFNAGYIDKVEETDEKDLSEEELMEMLNA